MEHEDAVRLGTAERYLLNELPPDERDEFEEHFFGCQECALDLRAGAAFLSQAKKEFRHQAASPVPGAARVNGTRRQNWVTALLRPAFAVPAFAALLGAVAYQNIVTIPRLDREAASPSQPEILPTISLISAGARGGETTFLQPAGKPFLLLFDIPGDTTGETHFENYTCSLYSPAGSLLWKTTISPEQAKDTVSVRVPALQAGGGTYSVVVHGNSAGNAVEVARYPFRLQN
jgi:hypothetical protein